MTERTDSHAWQHGIASQANDTTDLPQHIRLEAEDMPYWHGVLKEFPRVEWSQHSLELAAMLARAMADLEREQGQLRAEGALVPTGNGSVKSNPRNQAVNSHAALVLSIRRSLAMNARARTADTRTLANHREKAKGIESWLDDSDPDGLLARPWKEAGQ